MSIFAPAPPPKSNLGFHRVLSPSAGVKVSPLCLGTMNFGTQWEEFMGKCSKEDAFKVMDAFYDLGGNFVDTANNYQNDESEEWLGEWMESRGVRDQMVIATKYTTGYCSHRRSELPIQSNFVGNSSKSMRSSVQASLKKLRTDYVDILYLHWWDFSTGVDEVMHALNNLIVSGKVLYLGVSDTPAWVVVKANAYARQHGLRPFSVFQGKWNAADRDIEREIVPMCQDEGLAIAPWAPLGQGRLKTSTARSEKHTGSARASQSSEVEDRVSDVLEKLSARKGTTLQAIALAYIMHKTPNVFPVIGQRSVDHLRANVHALSVSLSKEEIYEIDGANHFDPGFPMNFIFRGKEYHTDLTAADVTLVGSVAHIDVPPRQAPVKAREQL